MSSLTPIISGIVGAGAVAVFSWLITRHGANATFSGSRHVLSYGFVARAFVVVLVLLLPGLILYLYVRGLAKMDVVLVILAFTALSAGYLIPEFFRTRIEFDDSTVYTFSPWRKPRAIPWSAFLSAMPSATMYWTTFETNGFGAVRVHDWLEGAAEFKECFERSRSGPNNALGREHGQ